MESVGFDLLVASARRATRPVAWILGMPLCWCVGVMNWWIGMWWVLCTECLYVQDMWAIKPSFEKCRGTGVFYYDCIKYLERCSMRGDFGAKIVARWSKVRGNIRLSVGSLALHHHPISFSESSPLADLAESNKGWYY